MEQLLNYLSIGGVFAFAISGALTAMNKKFDAFGVFVIAFATATGGGSLRDAFLADRTVFWLVEPVYTYIIIAGAGFAIAFRRRLEHFLKPLMFFDTLGLALYTVIGVEIGVQEELSPISSIALGTATGAFGGVLRDILVNDVPMIFKKEIYATISILGAAVYLVLHHFNVGYFALNIIPILLIIVLRLLVVVFNVKFPKIYWESEEEKEV